MTYKVSDLTPAERFALNRRRIDLDGSEYGEKYGHTKNQVSRWEKGKDVETIPQVVLHPKIMPSELLWIARRRVNETIHVTAAKIGVSHVTLLSWEKGRSSEDATSRGVRFWNKRGWPKRGR